jgi:hypothetical protein
MPLGRAGGPGGWPFRVPHCAEWLHTAIRPAAGREPHDISRKAATTEGHADISDIA